VKNEIEHRASNLLGLSGLDLHGNPLRHDAIEPSTRASTEVDQEGLA
jgi:hypothetical protein